MTDTQALIGKIHYVIKSANQFRDEQFRLVLEGLVEKAGKEAEYLLVKYILEKETPTETRINIMRSMGYIQNVIYLMPFKKIIEEEPDIRLKKAAILSLAKYNNERALNILNLALQSITNPILLKTINDKIQLIKQNHPTLSLMPRFLKGSTDIKANQVAIGIFKKILSPKDTSSFIQYKDHDDPLVRKGVFEVLCYCGDESIRKNITDIFRDRIDSSECLEEPKCDEIQTTTAHLGYYLEKYPALLDSQAENLQNLYSRVGDMKIKKTIMAMFCKSQTPEIFQFVKDAYEQDEEIRETIIDESAGNDLAVEFLFQQYQEGETLKEKLVKSLLKSDQGFRYFIRNFAQFPLEEQEIVIRNLPSSDRPEMIHFMKHILKSGAHSLKKYLLKNIRDYFLVSFRDLLFDPEKDEEYFSMEEEYIKTIFQVYPVSATKKMLSRIIDADLSLNQTLRILGYVKDAGEYEIVVNLGQPGGDERMRQLMNRIINMNNTELDQEFLGGLENLRTFDLQTYRNLSDNLNYFYKVKTKDDEMDEKSVLILRRIRESLKTQLEDIRRIEAIERDVKKTIAKTVPDMLQLKRIVESNGLGMAFRIQSLILIMVEYFSHAEDKALSHWRLFFKEFPLLMRLIREKRALGEPSGGSLLDQMRVVLSFEEPHLTALFIDQFNELLPNLNVTADSPHLNETDIFVCDTVKFKEYVKRDAMTTKRLYLLLDNRAEFSHYKDYAPRTFLRPVSAYKTARMILSDLYVVKPK